MKKEKIPFNYILQTYICHYPGISKQTYFFEFTIDDLYFETNRIYRSTRYLNITTKILDMNLYV